MSLNSHFRFPFLPNKCLYFGGADLLGIKIQRSLEFHYNSVYGLGLALRSSCLPTAGGDSLLTYCQEYFWFSGVTFNYSFVTLSPLLISSTALIAPINIHPLTLPYNYYFFPVNNKCRKHQTSVNFPFTGIYLGMEKTCDRYKTCFYI